MNEQERILENLIREFVGRLLEPVTNYLFELVHAGEPGLALEELCAHLGEAELTVDARQLQIIQRLGSIWQCDPKWWSELRTA
jgi:hypothetical protein